MLASLFLSSTPSLTLKPRSSTSSFHGVRIPSPNSLSFQKLRTPSSSVVMMAKREEELKEIRTKTNEELNEEILQLKGELFMMRIQKSAKEDKTSEFGRIRKRIARMMTVKREREVEQGIGKRLSRKLDKEWKKTIVVKPPPAFKKLQEERAKEAEKASSA